MAKTIKYVKPVQYRSATGLTADIYRQMQADFLPVPLLTLHSPVPEVMAGVWSILRETLLAGQVDRALKEAVAATVSKTNACPFCVDAHTAMLHATSNHDAASATFEVTTTASTMSSFMHSFNGYWQTGQPM